MSTLKADGIEAATGTNTDLTLAGKGTGVPDLAAGFKVGGTAGLPIDNLRVGTDGELITWDASGDPAAVAVGTATHVLTSNGAGAAPTFQAAGGGGAWSNSVSGTLTAASELIITSLPNVCRVTFMLTVVDGGGSYAVLSNDGGVTYETGASDYKYNVQGLSTNADAFVASRSTGAASMYLGDLGSFSEVFISGAAIAGDPTQLTHFINFGRNPATDNTKLNIGLALMVSEEVNDAIKFTFGTNTGVYYVDIPA